MGFFNKLVHGEYDKSFFNKLKGEGSGRYRGELRGLINQERESDRLFGEQAAAQLRQGLGARLQGFDEATARTSLMSRESRRGAVQRAGAMQGDLTNRFGAGGKYGTTALDNARMGLQSSLTQDLASIDQAFAGLFGELSIGRGEAESEGRGALAALSQDRSTQESELYRLLTGTIKPTRPGMFGGLMSALGAGAGTLLGGPAGGAMGGELGSALGSSWERD